MTKKNPHLKHSNYTTGKFTWNLKITDVEMKMLFQTSIIMFHVDFQGCTSF